MSPEVVRNIHTDHGVEIISNDQVVHFDGDTRVRRVETRAGRSIECDFVIVGVGVEPVTDAVTTAGLEISNGIVVDEYCRTNVEGIFAAGDVANHFHPVFGERMRVEHWNNAFRQSKVAARNMLGKSVPYDEIHSFWSDQYEYGIEYAGWHRDWDEIVVRGSLEERDFIAFYVNNGLVTATVGIDRAEEVQNVKDAHQGEEAGRSGSPARRNSRARPDSSLKEMRAGGGCWMLGTEDPSETIHQADATSSQRKGRALPPD